MKRGSKYEEMIKELPWEDGGRDMAPSIVAAAGIPVNKSVPEPDEIHQAFNWQVLQALTCLGLLLLISVYGFGWPNPRPLAQRSNGNQCYRHVDPGRRWIYGNPGKIFPRTVRVPALTIFMGVFDNEEVTVVFMYGVFVGSSNACGRSFTCLAGCRSPYSNTAGPGGQCIF